MWHLFRFTFYEKGLGPCVLSLWWGILRMTRLLSRWSLVGDDIQGEDDRDLGPVPGSWFLSSPKAQVCPGLRRGGGRPRRFCLHRNPITVSKVSYQASQPRFARKLETHFAINFFLQPVKTFTTPTYSPCLRTFYCQNVRKLTFYPHHALLIVNTVNKNSLTVMGARDGKERPPKLRPPAKKAMARMTISPIRRSESA